MKFAAALLFACLAFAQKPAADSPPLTEQEELSKALGEAGSSGTDLTRALEHHLQKYPATPQRAAIEKALAQWAIESNDRTRIVLYGERVLKAEPNNELQLIDHVIRALLSAGDADSAKKALVYVKRYEAQIEALRSRAAEGHMSPGQWAEQVNKNQSRALVLEARAQGILGSGEEAVKLATTAWNTSPGAEQARELARLLEKLGRREEAVERYADAFTIEDSTATDAERAADRQHAGELYKALHTSEKGLGDVFLSAYDRTRALKRERIARIKIDDPNFDAVEIVDFTLPRAGGGTSLPLASL
ncbi:MAG: hypothetical protein M3N54_12800, partial [Acidobacteriota bacterium]|nr:hypothetical protein [Acidobacteriota bacterium]